MSQLNFIWIDDDPSREVESRNLQESLHVSVKFIDVKNEDIALKGVLAGPEPDLILIDHNLKDISSGIFRKGSTVAAYIRETWMECPIICITGEDRKSVDSQKLSQYEEVFSISKVSDHYKTILSIAESFKKLNGAEPKSSDDLLQLINVPEQDREKFKAVIPKEVKDNFTDKGLLIDICHWMRRTLIERPGFLYDRLWTSTFLGLKEESFAKVEHLFAKAKYTGIFSDDSNERWWKSELLSILSETIQERGLPWQKGRKLSDIEKTDYSKCYATSEDYPETVAYIDETKNAKRAPMRLKNTVPHPNYEDLLFFEEIRMMKPAE